MATNNTKQAFWVTLGSFFAFGFGIVSSMILARYFPKQDYGTYKQVLYVYNTLVVVFTLGLPKAFSYYLPRIPVNQAKDLIKKITNLFFILGGSFTVILFVFSTFIASILRNPDLTLAIKIFSPVPLLLLPTMGLAGILATYQRNQFMAIYTVSTQLFIFLCVSLPVIILNGGYLQAIIGFVFASFLNFIFALYLKYMPLKHAGNDKCKISYYEIFRYSLPLMYASIFGIVISSADQFFISRYFGSSVFADFANGSLELPFVAMIIGASATVLTPLFSRHIHENLNAREAILPIWMNVFEKSVKIIYPIVLFAWFFADIIMIIMFGAIYKDAGTFFRIKLIVNLFTMISYIPLILAIGANRFYARVHLFHAIILVLLEYLSVKLFASPYLITAISVTCRIANISLMLVFISKYFEIRLMDLVPIKLILSIGLPSIFLLFSIRIVIDKYLSLSSINSLVVGAVFYFFLFYLWTLYRKIDYFYIFAPLFRR